MENNIYAGKIKNSWARRQFYLYCDLSYLVPRSKRWTGVFFKLLNKGRQLIVQRVAPENLRSKCWNTISANQPDRDLRADIYSHRSPTLCRPLQTFTEWPTQRTQINTRGVMVCRSSNYCTKYSICDIIYPRSTCRSAETCILVTFDGVSVCGNVCYVPQLVALWSTGPKG
jgi:hypothetical protein